MTEHMGNYAARLAAWRTRHQEQGLSAGGIVDRATGLGTANDRPPRLWDEDHSPFGSKPSFDDDELSDVERVRALVAKYETIADEARRAADYPIAGLAADVANDIRDALGDDQ